MKMELNNQSLAYIQAFETTTKLKVSGITVDDNKVVFLLDTRQKIDPRAVSRFKRMYRRIINKEILVVPHHRNPKIFICNYLKPIVNISPKDVSISRGIVVVRVPKSKRKLVVGRNGVRVKQLESLMKELYKNIKKIIILGVEEEKQVRENVRKESS